MISGFDWYPMNLKCKPWRRRAYRGTSLVRKPLPLRPSVGLCLGPYGDPRGGAVSYERGTPVGSVRGTHGHQVAGGVAHEQGCEDRVWKEPLDDVRAMTPTSSRGELFPNSVRTKETLRFRPHVTPCPETDPVLRVWGSGFKLYGVGRGWITVWGEGLTTATARESLGAPRHDPSDSISKHLRFINLLQGNLLHRTIFVNIIMK